MACGICTDDVALDAVGFLGCGHNFCFDCLYQYVKVSALDNGQHPTCPECSEPLEAAELPEILAHAADRAEAERVGEILAGQDLRALGATKSAGGGGVSFLVDLTSLICFEFWKIQCAFGWLRESHPLSHRLLARFFLKKKNGPRQ